MTASRASHSRSRRFPERAKSGRTSGLVDEADRVDRSREHLPAPLRKMGKRRPGSRGETMELGAILVVRRSPPAVQPRGHLRFPEYGAYLYRPGAGVTIRGTQVQGLADSLLSHQHRNGKIGEHRAQGQGPSLNGQALARGAFIEILAGSMRTSYPGHGLRLTRAVPRPSG